MVPFRLAMLVVSSIVAVCCSLARDLDDCVPSMARKIMAPFGILDTCGAEEFQTWTVVHLHAIAKTKTVANAVSRLAGGASSPDGAELKKVIDNMTAAQIGAALLGQALSDADSLAKFAKFIASSDHPEGATCGQAGTAGAHGLNACTAQCERKWPLSKTPPGAACYALCSMAVAPCGLRPFTWRRWFNEGHEMATAGAKGFYALCLHLSGYEYLIGVLRRYVFYHAQVKIFLQALGAILFLLSWVGFLSWLSYREHEREMKELKKQTEESKREWVEWMKRQRELDREEREELDRLNLAFIEEIRDSDLYTVSHGSFASLGEFSPVPVPIDGIPDESDQPEGVESEKLWRELEREEKEELEREERDEPERLNSVFIEGLRESHGTGYRQAQLPF